MKITILTLFPEMFDGFINTSIIKRAIAKNAIEIEIKNIRDYTLDKYGRVDSAPFGGGAGLIIKCQPIIDALESVKTPNSHVILMSPAGITFNQGYSHKYATYEHLIIICGHYEGVDSRVEQYVDECVSIGDYILTGGELGAMVISDAVIRLIDGAISHDSIVEETFENGLLEYPQYTEPYDYRGAKVPDILFSGNHEAINKWRQKQSLKITREKRSDLFEKYSPSKKDLKLLKEIDANETGKWETDAIEKGHKFIKK